MDAHSFYLLGLNTLVEPVVDNGRMKVLPPRGLLDEGKVEWECGSLVMGFPHNQNKR